MTISFYLSIYKNWHFHKIRFMGVTRGGSMGSGPPPWDWNLYEKIFWTPFKNRKFMRKRIRTPPRGVGPPSSKNFWVRPWEGLTGINAVCNKFINLLRKQKDMKIIKFRFWLVKRINEIEPAMYKLRGI